MNNQLVIRRVEYFFMLLVFLVATIKGIYLSRFGINIYNYGETLHNASRLLDGQILYKDIWSFFPPGFSYFPAFIIKIFGRDLTSVRYVESIIFALLALLIYSSTKDFIARKYRLLLAAVIILSDVNVYLLFYLLFFYFSLISLYYFLKTKNRYLLSLSAILAGLGFFFRHDTAIEVIIVVILMLLLYCKTGLIKSKLSRLLVDSLLYFGLTISVSLMLVRKTTSLNEFLYLAFIRAPSISKALSNDSILKDVLRFEISTRYALTVFTLFFYVISLLIYIFIFFYFYKRIDFRNIKTSTKRNLRKHTGVIIFAFFGLLELAHALSIIEMGHLVKAGIPIMILGVFLMQEAQKKYKNVFVKFIIVIPISLFILGNILMTCSWIDFNDKKVDLGYGSIYLNSNYIPNSTHVSSDTLAGSIDFIKNNTKESEYIFVAPYHAILYYLTDRKSPSKYNNFASGILPESEQDELIQNIEENKVKVVVYDPQNAPHNISMKSSSPKVHSYIMSEYTTISESPEGWLFMKRNE